MTHRVRILGVRRFSGFWWRLLWARLNIYNRLFCWWIDLRYRVFPYDRSSAQRSAEGAHINEGDQQ